MTYKRLMIQEAGMVRTSRQGDTVENPVITTVTADANDTITVAKIAGGVIQYTGFTVGRTLTTDTAAAILAGHPEMDVGDSVFIVVSIVPALAGTFAAGVGVTLAGRPTCPAASSVDVYITRTGPATLTWTVL